EPRRLRSSFAGMRSRPAREHTRASNRDRTPKGPTDRSTRFRGRARPRCAAAPSPCDPWGSATPRAGRVQTRRKRGKQSAMDHSPRFLKLCEAARAGVKEVSIDEVRERMDRGDRFELVDVREDGEYARGKIAGARHLGRGVLERDIEKAIPDPN